MRYLKTYKMILEDFNKNDAYQHEYSIFDFTNDLKSKRPFSEKALKMWLDHFIGLGYYEKIIKLVDDIFLVLDKVDIDSIGDRLVHIFDQYPDYDSMFSEIIAYGSYVRFNYNKDDKSTLFTGDIYTKEKSFLIEKIILDIINPTLNLRKTDDEIYVKDKKWQCSNIVPEMASGYQSVRKRHIDGYSVDNFFKLYKPGIKITLGNEFGSASASLYMLEVQKKFKELIPVIIKDIKYTGLEIDEVIYPFTGNWLSKETRISSYTIKILLK